MKRSRRDFAFLLPALAATASAQNAAQNTKQVGPAADNSVEKLPVIKTEAFLYKDLPITVNGQNKNRRMFTAKTHTGFKIESHQSDIAPAK